MRHLYLSEARLKEILDKFPQLNIAIVGDFFLDYYLVLDKKLSEVSLETSLEAFQVVKTKKSPGAAGTVASILRSLDVNVTAIGFTGDDGNGFDLRFELRERGVNINHLSIFKDRFTPTYMKPMLLENNEERELSRLDIKNRQSLTVEQESEIIYNINQVLPRNDAIVILDQVREINCGVVSDCILKEIAQMAQDQPEKLFIGDSREHADRLKNVTLKCNLGEARKALVFDKTKSSELKVQEVGERLLVSNKKPVYITLGENGIFAITNDGSCLIPTLKVKGPLDIVGAGDSVMASISAALCAGADFREAASIGMITASIIVQQIGTTGIATRSQVLKRYQNYFSQ